MIRSQRNHFGCLWIIAIACAIAAALPAGASAKEAVKIAVIDAKGTAVGQSDSGRLELNRKYAKGDRIVVTGAKHVFVKADEHFAEALLFAPKGKVDYTVPLWQKGKYANRLPYPPKAFAGDRHVITARAATEKEINAYRNLALNPMDPRGTSVMYPHASSNSEWGEAGVFAARNAIDGFVETTGDHHSWPRQSWGPYLPGGSKKHPKPEMTIEFGRPVEIDKLVVVVRHNVRQNNHWKQATVEFSDGSKTAITAQFNGKRQEFPIAKRTVTSMKFTALVSDKPGKYAAFVEVEAWGRPAGASPAAAAAGKPGPFFALCMDTHDSKKRNLAQQAEMLKELGYDGAGHLWLKNVPQRLKTLDAAGLKLFHIYTRVNVSPKSKRPYDPKLKEVIGLLKGRPTAIVLLVAGMRPSDTAGDPRAVKLIGEIADLAAKSSVKVILYPHTRDWLERVSDAVRIAKKVNRPNVGVMFNLCHWLKADSGKDLEGTLKLAKPYLLGVSIHGADTAAEINSGKGKWIQPLGSGSFDVGALVKMLRDTGYTGPVGLQCYGLRGDARDHLKRSIAAWRKLCGK